MNHDVPLGDPTENIQRQTVYIKNVPLTCILRSSNSRNFTNFPFVIFEIPYKNPDMRNRNITEQVKLNFTNESRKHTNNNNYKN